MERDFPYARAVLLFSTAVLAVLTFAGLYFDVAITLISLPFLVFFVVLFMGWSNNRALNRGEMRRTIAATFVAAFMVLVIGNRYISVPAELRDYLLGVLSTIIGFYFGYRGRETEEERMARIMGVLSTKAIEESEREKP